MKREGHNKICWEDHQRNGTCTQNPQQQRKAEKITKGYCRGKGIINGNVIVKVSKEFLMIFKQLSSI